MSKHLESIQTPADLAKLSFPALNELSSEIREFLVEKVWRQIISANLSIQKVLKIGDSS